MWRIKKTPPEKPYTMAEAIKFIAKLGGFIGTKSDGPPGVKVIWVGLSKLYVLLTHREFVGQV